MDVIEKAKEFANLELYARQLVEGFITGLHQSPYHGFSVEFAEHRLYNTGESTRHIDWKVYARTDKLFTKRYEEETNLRCMLVLDNSSSMYYPTDNQLKIKFSTVAAAALAYMLKTQRDAVGLTLFAEQIESISAVKSTESHIRQLFVQLTQLLQQDAGQKRTSVADVLHEIAERTHKRSLVVIFSDMMDQAGQQAEIFSALQHLKHNKHEVLLFHVHDKQTELDFDFPERPIIFTDVETGAQEKVRPALVKDYYQSQLKAWFTELKIKCGQYKIDLIEADCRQSLEQVLLPYLIKRKRMR